MQKIYKIGRNLLIVVISILLCLWILDLALWQLDPRGAWGATFDRYQMLRVLVPHPTGYAYEAGNYDLAVYDARILDDGTRYVPESNEAANCTIALIGDSFTFGLGVDDEATFANLIAREFDLRILNTGRPTYNSSQVLLLRDYYEADGYIYLHILNDNEPIQNLERLPADAPVPFALEVYLAGFTRILTGTNSQTPNSPTAESIAAYEIAMEEIMNQSDILAFAFDDDALGSEALSRYEGLIAIDDASYLDNPVSSNDRHPNALGHQRIFEAMQASIANWLPSVCES